MKRLSLLVAGILLLARQAGATSYPYVPATYFNYHYAQPAVTLSFSPLRYGGTGKLVFDEPEGYPETTYTYGYETNEGFAPHLQFGFFVYGHDDFPYPDVTFRFAAPLFCLGDESNCTDVEFRESGFGAGWIFSGGSDFQRQNYLEAAITFDTDQDIVGWSIGYANDGDGRGFGSDGSRVSIPGLGDVTAYDSYFDQLGYYSNTTAPGRWRKEVQQGCFFYDEALAVFDGFVPCPAVAPEAPAPVPLPAALPLLGAALGGLVIVRRARRA